MGNELTFSGVPETFEARLPSRRIPIVRIPRTRFATRANNMALVETIAIDANATSAITAGKPSYSTRNSVRI